MKIKFTKTGMGGEFLRLTASVNCAKEQEKKAEKTTGGRFRLFCGTEPKPSCMTRRIPLGKC